MRIGLDFDETYTADPGLWDAFIALARERGHSVVCVTARCDTPENRAEVKVPGVWSRFTSLASKTWFMDERGEHVDIWIDNDPRTCALGY